MERLFRGLPTGAKESPQPMYQMPAAAATMACPFCEYVGRSDHVNRHILLIHQEPSNVIGDFAMHSVSLHPSRRKIVIVKSRAGQEVLCYCFDCFTKTRAMTGCSLSKAANKHVCCRKKVPPSGPATDAVPHLEITETAAPVAAPAPAPAAVITIEKMCQAVAEYLAELYPEGTGFHRRYKDHINLREELDGDTEMTSWLTFVKEEISTADKSIEIVMDKQLEIDGLRRLLVAEKRRADSYETSYNTEKKENAKLIAALEDAPAAHTRDLEFFKQKLREAHKLLKDRGIPLEPPKLDG